MVAVDEHKTSNDLRKCRASEITFQAELGNLGLKQSYNFRISSQAHLDS